jgi:hypothetical protein
MADLAPTYAELLDFRFPRRDGTVLEEALVPESNRPEPPRLIVTLVWDGGGRNVIDFHEEEHPFLTSLIEQGTWYERAEVGSAPSSTGPVHPVMGTGAFPRKHGLVGNDLFIDDKGTIGGPWTFGPRLLLLPTLADLYDKALGNEPLVGLVGTTPWYLGMIGRGAFQPGGDRDTVVLRTEIGDEGAEGNYWNIPGIFRPFYDLAEYVNDLPKLREYFPVADAADGATDGLWRGNDILDLDGGFDSPARLPYQSEVIREVIEREGFGQDDVPDLFYTNYKLIDEVGHRWYFSSDEMGDTIREQDRQLEELVGFLDDRVGRGNYVLALTSDHGHTPDPRLTGGFRISSAAFKAGITETFDDDGDDVELLLGAKPTYLFLNPLEMKNEEELENGLTLSQMARYLLSLTKEDVAFTEATPTGPPNVPTGRARDDPVIAAAFPSHMFDDLPCLPEASAG